MVMTKAFFVTKSRGSRCGSRPPVGRKALRPTSECACRGIEGCRVGAVSAGLLGEVDTGGGAKEWRDDDAGASASAGREADVGEPEFATSSNVEPAGREAEGKGMGGAHEGAGSLARVGVESGGEVRREDVGTGGFGRADEPHRGGAGHALQAAAEDGVDDEIEGGDLERGAEVEEPRRGLTEGEQLLAQDAVGLGGVAGRDDDDVDASISEVTGSADAGGAGATRAREHQDGGALPRRAQKVEGGEGELEAGEFDRLAA